jgi:hypothetical protein
VGNSLDHCKLTEFQFRLTGILTAE